MRQSVEDTLNALLNAEADAICHAGRYKRTPDRLDTRAGTYRRKLLTTAGEVELKVPRLRSLPFETEIIKRYQTKQSSVEEALIEMYLAGVSVRRVEDITEALWGTKVSPSTVSELNQKIYGKIEEWRMQPIIGEHPYIFVDGVYLKRSWGGEVQNVSALVAAKLRKLKLEKVAEFVENSVEETLSYMDFPYEHWSRLRTNNGLERIMKEIRRRTRGVGSFPDGYSAMMLVGARLRHISTTKWGTRQYMNTCKLYEVGV